MTKKLAEANFQTKLKTDLKEAGWKIIKLQSGMGYTVLDLYLSSVLFGPMWWELKTIPTANCKIPITPLQRLEVKQLQEGGSLAMIATCVKVGRDNRLYLTTNYEEEYVSGDYIERKHGEQWNASLIGRRCDLARKGLNLWGQRD